MMYSLRSKLSVENYIYYTRNNFNNYIYIIYVNDREAFNSQLVFMWERIYGCT